MSATRFGLLRPLHLIRGVLANRDRPDFARLQAIEAPEEFVWEILPHAARSFAPCITLLPQAAARAAAVAYLYCRMLDTYEDLLPGARPREAALRRFAGRFEGGNGEPVAAPAPLDAPAVRDARDRAHVLLVERAGLVDRVFLDLDPAIRGIVADLVRDMASGMVRYSRAFDGQGGVLRTEEQVTGYCRAVIGNPVVFTLRLLRYVHAGDADLPPATVEHAMRVGEFVQLANVTRDIEKDLARGVAYRPELGPDLEGARRPGRRERIRSARRELLGLALSRAPSWRRMVEDMDLPRISIARASTLLMLLYTHRYYARCAARCGLAPFSGGVNRIGLILIALPAVFSPAFADRMLTRAERDFKRAERAIRAGEG